MINVLLLFKVDIKYLNMSYNKGHRLVKIYNNKK